MSGVLVMADIRFPLPRANGVQIVKTSAALAARGLATTLLVRHSDVRPTPEILALYGVSADGLRVRRVNVGHRAGFFVLPRLVYLLRAALAGIGAARRGDVIFTRDLQLADALLALPGVRRRVVYEAHAVESLMYAERGALYGSDETADPAKAARIAGRERRVWRRAAALVTTTTGIRDSFAQAYGEREDVIVVPNGCDVPASREFPGLPPQNQPRVVYAGQLYPWKGVDVLVEAMAAVADARLLILGGIESERDYERVRALVARHDLESRTEMPGTVPQARVADELARASVVVVPYLHTSMTERHTSPIKAFEALAAGRPIVASDLPSSREILQHEQTALLVPPGDAAALGAAIARVLNDRDLAERLARRAWDDAPRFSWDARAGHLAELFGKVAA